MKKLQLLRVDNDVVRKVDLHIGTNIISRNVVIGCDDDRVIKKAVTIDVSPNNEMTITAYQIAPCYMKTTESSKWKLLKLGTSVPIKPGYICSLLSDKCWLKIISVPEEMDNNEGNASKRKANEDVESSTPEKKQCSGDGDNLQSLNDAFIKLVNDNDSTKVNIGENNGSSLACGTSAERIKYSRSEGIRESLERQESSKTGKNACSSANLVEKRNKFIVDGQTASSNNKNILREDMQNNVSTKTHNANGSTSSKEKIRREKCRYAEECYRKNLEHKAKFSHPHDSDYNIPDRRQPCPYGERCYRKNPNHKIEYKHNGSNITSEENKYYRHTPAEPSTYDLDEIDYTSTEESVDESEYEPSSDDDMYCGNNESD